MLYSAFIMGLLGSLHCLGMCGPLVLALPQHGPNRLQALSGRLVYNGGRIFTYSLAGVAAGTFGQSLTWFTSQQQLSVAIGIVILLFILLPQVTRKINFAQPVAKFTAGIKKQFSHQFKQRTYKAFFLSGMLNGLLPCGLVYIALAGAIATGKGYSGAAYMALFGAGTLPIMLAVSLAGHYITAQWRSKLTRLVPGFTICLACLFILRGLNLGIPVVSPSVAKTINGTQINCCHKK